MVDLQYEAMKSKYKSCSSYRKRKGREKERGKLAQITKIIL